MSDNPNYDLDDTWPDIGDDETQELPAIEPDGWDDLVERERERPPEAPPNEPADWRFERREAVTPDGQPLGVVLFVSTPDPDPAPEFDQPPERRALEIAHFETPAAAERFEREFRDYLVPGLLGAPELAESVASLEGLPGEWTSLDDQSDAALVRDPADWHVYDPNPERNTDAPPLELDW